MVTLHLSLQIFYPESVMRIQPYNRFRTLMQEIMEMQP